MDFANWLESENFDTFATFTTKHELSLQGARRMAERFHRAFDLLKMFWVAEPFDTRCGYHFHALLNTHDRNGIVNYKRTELFNWWTHEKEYGRSDFQKINKAFNQIDWTPEYITKYWSKFLSDFDFYTGERGTNKPEFIASTPKELQQHNVDKKTVYLSEERKHYLNICLTKTKNNV